MKLDIVASSGNDEFYTPPYAISPILPYLLGLTVWCPFDTAESHFVKMLTAQGNRVIRSHLSEGRDFFAWTPRKYDVIVSNPPYSMKNEVFERLFALDKPFAMLVGVVGLFESQRRFNLFAKNRFEIMFLDKRIAYFKSYSDQKPSLNPPFSSVYLTSRLLPKQVVFATVARDVR